jgi:hypothetical protein
MNVLEIVKAFDVFLEKYHVHLDLIVVGGAALNLLEVTSRVTYDIDSLQRLPEHVVRLAQEFAKINNLPIEWLNSGPEELAQHLPIQWKDRVQIIYKGLNLSISTLGRLELIMSKCWAYCDRERDLDDIIALKPTSVELDSIQNWLIPLDANPKWPDYVRYRIAILKKYCGI